MACGMRWTPTSAELDIPGEGVSPGGELCGSPEPSSSAGQDHRRCTSDLLTGLCLGFPGVSLEGQSGPL